MKIVFYRFQSEKGRSLSFASASSLDESAVQAFEERFAKEIGPSDAVVTLTKRVTIDPILCITRDKTARYTEGKKNLDIQEGGGYKLCLIIDGKDFYYSTESMGKEGVEKIVGRFLSMSTQSVIKLSKGSFATSHSS